MDISKEKVDGWLVGYAGKEYYKWDCYPLIISAKKFRVIPAVLLKLANSPEGWGMLDFELDFNECKCLKHLRWKSELNFEEIGFLQNAEPIPEFQDVMDKAIRQYLDYEKFSLEHWKAFCNSYKTIIEKIGFEEACKGVFVDEKDFPVNPLDLAEAPTPSLVRSDPDSVVPADSALEAITAFIYDGITKEIKAPVRDSKRKTTLAEQEKTNAKLDSINEKIVLLEEKIELILQNTGRISREIIERIERKWNKGYRRYWQYEILGLGPEAIWEWENPGMTLKGLDAEEKKQELTPIYTSLNRARDKEESKKGKR